MSLDEQALDSLKKLLRQPRTLMELEDGAGISRRTVFRYLAVLKERGFNVVKWGLSRPTQYRINT